MPQQFPDTHTAAQPVGRAAGPRAWLWVRAGAAGTPMALGRGSRDPDGTRQGQPGHGTGPPANTTVNTSNRGCGDEGRGAAGAGPVQAEVLTTRPPEEGNTPKAQPVFLRKVKQFYSTG